MSNRPLRACPKCGSNLDVGGARESMGLQSGAILNLMCPGLNGPSDIDHVLHNGENDRVAIFEYKRDSATLTPGQAKILTALNGDWMERSTGRMLHVRLFVIDVYASEDDALVAYDAAVQWLWPDVDWRVTYDKLSAYAANHPYKASLDEIEEEAARLEDVVEHMAALIAEYRTGHL